MALINGAQGIGTGYSTSIPNHNPKDIIKMIYKKLDGEDISDYEIKRFRDFKGTVIKSSKGSGYITKGKYVDFKYNNFGNHGVTNWCLDGRLQRVFGFNFN